MTISTTSNTVVAQGNGLTTSFDFTFPVPLASELFVYFTNASNVTTLLTASQYSVTGIGTDDGGAVTYPLSGSPIPAGTTLTIQRVVPYQQLTSLVDQSGYYPNVVENALDYLTMQTQQLAQEVQLSLQVPQASTAPDLLLPSATARAGQLVGFDANGNAITYPVTASVGAGNMTDTVFVANTDFTPGVTTTLTLPGPFGSAPNVFAYFDGTPQFGFTILGTAIIFPDPIPEGINQVFIKGGTTLSTGVPSQGSVGPAQIAAGAVGAMQLANGAVGSAELANGAVGSAQLQAGIIVTSSLVANSPLYNRATQEFFITDFGLIDGVHDTATLQAALAYIASIGSGALVFPALTYNFSENVAYTFPNAVASLSLLGMGGDTSILKWASGGGLTINFLGAFNSVHIRDMSFVTGTTNVGSAITLNQTATSIPNPANTALSDISNVTVRGADGYESTDYWQTGITVTGVSNVNFLGVTVVGPSGALGVGVDVSGTASLPPVVFQFIQCTMNALSNGFVYGNYVQGVTLLQCNVTGCVSGISVPPGSTALDELIIVGCQIATTGAAVIVASSTGIPNLVLVGNLLSVLSNNVSAVQITAAGVFTIVGNSITGPSATPANVNGISITSSSGVGLINGNVFFWIVTGVVLAVGTGGINVQSNAYWAGITTKVLNNGSGNTIGGGSE